ncbi:hypothetical protein NKI99_33245, partial [Mesorhizobium sp. M0239]
MAWLRKAVINALEPWLREQLTLNAGRYKVGQPNVLTLCGVLIHSSLAVTLTGTPLGLTAVKFWTRTKFKG